MLQGVNGFFAGDGGKVIEKVVESLAAFEIIQKRLERNTDCPGRRVFLQVFPGP